MSRRPPHIGIPWDFTQGPVRIGLVGGTAVSVVLGVVLGMMIGTVTGIGTGALGSSRREY